MSSNPMETALGVMTNKLIIVPIPCLSSMKYCNNMLENWYNTNTVTSFPIYSMREPSAPNLDPSIK